MGRKAGLAGHAFELLVETRLADARLAAKHDHLADAVFAAGTQDRRELPQLCAPADKRPGIR